MTARNKLWTALIFIIAITLPACKTTKVTKNIADSTNIDDIADTTVETIDGIADNTDETIGDTAEKIDESTKGIADSKGEAKVLIWDELVWDGNEWE